jgi:hypothetical protein
MKNGSEHTTFIIGASREDPQSEVKGETGTFPSGVSIEQGRCRIFIYPDQFEEFNRAFGRLSGKESAGHQKEFHKEPVSSEEQDKPKFQISMGLPGWVCPKCGSVYSPTISGCWRCNRSQQFIVTS